MRVFPIQISAAEVDTLLRKLDVATPYTDDNWKTASIDFDCLNITINIGLTDSSFTDRKRRRIASIIRKLPDLQKGVNEIPAETERDTGEHHCQLSWIDIDLDHGEVDLCYDGITFNAQWNKTYQLPDELG